MDLESELINFKHMSKITILSISLEIAVRLISQDIMIS